MRSVREQPLSSAPRADHDGAGTPWQLSAIALFDWLGRASRPVLKNATGIVIIVLVGPFLHSAYPLDRVAEIRDAQEAARPQPAPIGTPATQQPGLRSRILSRSMPLGWNRDETPTVKPMIENRFGKALTETYHCPVTVCGTDSRLVLASFAIPASTDPAMVGELVKEIVADLDIADRSAASAAVTHRQADNQRAPKSGLLPEHAAYANHLWGAGIAKQSHGPPASEMKRVDLVILQVRDTWDGWRQRARAQLGALIPAMK